MSDAYPPATRDANPVAVVRPYHTFHWSYFLGPDIPKLLRACYGQTSPILIVECWGQALPMFYYNEPSPCPGQSWTIEHFCPITASVDETTGIIRFQGTVGPSGAPAYFYYSPNTHWSPEHDHVSRVAVLRGTDLSHLSLRYQELHDA